ncbi:MAG: hypothetical protein IKW80_07185, partial [Thermoguttaceae bacterium]|nr:hypothetical protein [Thermoguttaceae bacterium]
NGIVVICIFYLSDANHILTHLPAADNKTSPLTIQLYYNMNFIFMEPSPAKFPQKENLFGQFFRKREP